ncbi:hypothetical protein [Natronorubrum halophilum]|uniref:hypothetical protein n=1 Tax=Natronorubrum halophilum TaxID=1702106 RepID=UPI0013CF061E|nr:hypothetical protein [Natronorubrum halophilum]
MTVSTRSHAETGFEREPSHAPEIAVCESRPERSIFLESGNTDGWIASDVTIAIVR